MPLESGTRIGPYSIVSPIGKGGMGEVYRARDTKLERDVAIKVLPDELADDEERVARFEREAKMLASLNHPNIASIYGFESGTLVLELVEGPTLAELIDRGPISIEETAAIAKQIADALEAGHEAGVIHRDLKPANIKVQEDGTVKVLDYGLAKALESDVAGEADPLLSHSPTLTRQATQIGVVLGTAAYMSPEQAKGKRVDRRSDVWAFGAVMYEMLTGQRAFPGNDVSEVLASVLAREPDWSALPPNLSDVVGVYLRRCLHKDLKGRIRDIGDVRLAMDGAFDSLIAERVAAPTDPSGRLARFPVIAGVAALAALGGGLIAASLTRQPEAKRGVIRSLIDASGPLASEGMLSDLAIGRDGSFVVYRRLRGSEPDAYQSLPGLYLRRLDQLEGEPLRSTSAGNSPFVSRDGQWIGFGVGDELKKISVLGGPPVTLGSAPFPPRGGTWGDDGRIIVGSADGGLYEVPEGGGVFEALSEAEALESHRWPSILPDGKSLVFVIHLGGLAGSELANLALDTGEVTRLGVAGTSPRYVETGHIVYAIDDGSVRAIAYDPERREVSGNPVPLLENVVVKISGAASFDISDQGRVVYWEGFNRGERRLVWVHRDGTEEAIDARPGSYVTPQLSPDGTRVAVDRTDGNRPDIWILDLARGTDMKLTADPIEEMNPLWTLDGSRVVYALRNGSSKFAVISRSADGTGEAERLLAIDDSASAVGPTSWSADGKTLAYWIVKGAPDIETLTIGGERSSLLATEFSEQAPAISPNGEWIAYASNESGQFEIYVQKFPDLGQRLSVSTAGGRQPLWSRDGRELFYRSRAGVMAAAVDTGANFSAGEPSVLFEDKYYFFLSRRTYDVAPDGQRFLMVGHGVDNSDERPLRMHLIENWFEELTERVPIE